MCAYVQQGGVAHTPYDVDREVPHHTVYVYQYYSRASITSL